MGSTLINGYSYPEGTDPPVTATDLRRALEEVGRGGIMRFASAAARTTAFATLGISPSEGMVSYLEDSDRHEMHDGTAWRIYPLGIYRSSQLLTGAVATVTFTNIPSTLRRLELTWTARSSAAAVAQNLRLRINGDSTAIYNYNFTQQQNTTNTGIAGVAQTYWQVGVIAGATATANNFGAGELVIPGWNAPHPSLNHNHRSHFYESAANSWYQHGGGLYFAAGPFTRIDLFADAGNLIAGSEFVLTGHE